ncbi:MAG TPA: nitroreductase/quinone reductase family protein [Rubrobacter sp.]|nr:nitroreductase/quinone reductase family protein [Rubrobacter sp.]
MTATRTEGKAGKRSPHGLVNPAILRLLSSRLHFVLSGGTLVLTVTGRRSGRRYDVPLNWVPSGDGGLVCFTGGAWSGWWKNVSADGTPASVTLRGERLPATARLVGDPEAVERGLRLFLARFPSNAKPFGVALGRGKLPDEEDLARAARDGGTVMVEIRPLGAPEA